MSNERETQKEVRRIVRMLEATTRILEKPSVFDHFSDGQDRCIRQFNSALSRLYDLEALPEGLFEPLDEGSSVSVGDIGYAYHQVATYLKEGIGFDFDLDFQKEKETIGNVMKDVGEVVSRSIFSMRETDSEDDESSESTIEVVEVEDDEKPDPVEPRLDKLEEQMETVVEILQELRSKKGKKEKKDD